MTDIPLNIVSLQIPPPIKMPIIKPEFDQHIKEILIGVEKVLTSNMVSNVNKYVTDFENTLRELLDVKHVIATNSCTISMMLVLQALGIRGKTVAIPSFTFSATAHMAHWTNNRIQFVEIDPLTLTMDPDHLNEVITKDTAAVLAVHLYGNPADHRGLEEICEDYNIPLLYDAAHALGSMLNGKSVASLGFASAFSLSPTKLISSLEGGLVATNDDGLAKKIKILRNYGNLPDYTCEIPGLNARMNEVEAIVGLALAKDISEAVKNRNKYAHFLISSLSRIPGVSFQKIQHKGISSYKDFSIFINPEQFGLNRDELSIVLRYEGIQTKYYFHPPIHLLDAYKAFSSYELPITDEKSKSVLSLPIYNHMTKSQLNSLVNTISIAHDYASDIKKLLQDRA